jgi:hypothetical protein
MLAGRLSVEHVHLGDQDLEATVGHLVQEPPVGGGVEPLGEPVGEQVRLDPQRVHGHAVGQQLVDHLQGGAPPGAGLVAELVHRLEAELVQHQQGVRVLPMGDVEGLGHVRRADRLVPGHVGPQPAHPFGVGDLVGHTPGVHPAPVVADHGPDCAEQ